MIVLQPEEVIAFLTNQVKSLTAFTTGLILFASLHLSIEIQPHNEAVHTLKQTAKKSAISLSTGIQVHNVTAHSFNKIVKEPAINLSTGIQNHDATTHSFTQTVKEPAVNHSIHSPICENGYNEIIRLCCMSSSPQEFGNTRKSNRVLILKINDVDVKIFIRVHQVTLPNATIIYASESNRMVPIYREDISRKLYKFYTGSIVALHVSFPFTARWNGVQFLGSAYIFNLHLKLECKSNIGSTFYTLDHCFNCQASCSKHIWDGKSSGTEAIDFKDLFNIDYMGPNSESISMHSSSYAEGGGKLNRRERSGFRQYEGPVSCVLHVVGDYLFYKFIGHGDVMYTINTMLSIINDVDAIFRSTDFDGDQRGDSFGFLVGRITVLNNNTHPSFKLSDPFLTSQEYLVRFSKYDFSDVCLGVGFTYRDFSGIGGSAYPGHSDLSIPGGLCQERIRVGSEFFSFNTAFVTALSLGKTLEANLVMLLLAHELGHSLGSRHDMDPSCHPENEDGNFIMSAEANLDKAPNNRRFSTCSILSMFPVIKKKGFCLIRSDSAPLCGNSIPETGEECDCGVSATCEEIDHCCTPADEKGFTDIPCTPRTSRGKLCSPKVSLCCSESCSYVPYSSKHVCDAQQDCFDVSICPGDSIYCPLGDPLPNGTRCNSKLGICNEGRCSRNVCEHHNLTACYCTKPIDQCKLCCWDVSKEECKPASILTDSQEMIYLENGAPCHDSGVCDMSHECVPNIINFSASKAFLGFSSPHELRTYLKNYWGYYIFTSLSVFFFIVILFISYHLDDVEYLKALRYGKMLAVYATGEHQTKVYRKTFVDVDDYYSLKIYQLHQHCEAKSLIEALARLQIFFPGVSISHLLRIAKLSAAEHIAVKILLLQRFRMRTFTSGKNTGDWVYSEV